jgi:Smg protein
MKENVLDILVYLLENFMYGEMDDKADEASLKAELLRAGFPDQEIEKAFSWLEDLSALRDNSPGLPVTSHHALRVYTPAEVKRLDAECRGFLMFLEQIGVLDPLSRELVIDRIMALETDETELTDLKWVILMVLFNQPGKEAAFAWMEDLVFEGTAGWLH